MSLVNVFFQQNAMNLVALLWFFLCFRGYMIYAKKAMYTTPCLSSVLHMYRHEWMVKLHERENRIADNAGIANLERSVSFFASTTMLILAGLMTVLGSTDKAIDVIADIPFAVQATREEWEIKIVMMIVLFVYAFFKFTWSLRQYGFVTVMIGGVPRPADGVSAQVCQANAARIAKMTSLAANNFNNGLRTYYFSQAMLGWFINPVLFMGLSTLIVYILYRREFKSSTLKTLMMSVEPDTK
ncbi:DUF599 domain-containing protein [Neptunomonas phycophila]|uniref:DUF599 domain-containing protein n=1 Tax=Neptunomonas phycophila TaxID=1572645 RepID=UPI003BAC865A